MYLIIMKTLAGLGARVGAGGGGSICFFLKKTFLVYLVFPC